MMKHQDLHGDRMKGYEDALDCRLDVHKPIYARIDGRAFSRFTRKMERPFDRRMSRAMIETMKGLVEDAHARVGYTQSDEISLVFLADGENSDIFFAGRLAKMTSILASLATAHFIAQCNKTGIAWDQLPHFDCRICQLPDETEAANMVLWRYKDCIKNSIQMLAQAHFSPHQLDGKHGGEMKEMLRVKGINYDELPAFFRFGTFGRRITRERDLTVDELARIPKNRRPSGPVMRSEIVEFVAEDFLSAKNREEIVFAPINYPDPPSRPTRTAAEILGRMK